jgi:hypothetical protein
MPQLTTEIMKVVKSEKLACLIPKKWRTKKKQPGLKQKTHRTSHPPGLELRILWEKASEAGVVEIELPVIQGEDALLALDTEGGGCSIRGDPRILNFRIFGLRLA